MTDSLLRRHIPIPGAHNVRDLGGYRTAGGAIIPWRRFIRADSLHRIDDTGIDRLMREGLRTVIDLRSPAEAADAPNPLRRLADVDFHNLPVFDELAPAALGQRKPDLDDPLLDFYLTALHTRHDAFREIFAAMAEAKQGAIIFNCTAGKDRTGLIAALLLSLADVTREDVIADYVLTAKLIPDLVAEFLELSRQSGGDVQSYARMLRSPPRTMAAALDALEDGFGGARGYLEYSGVPDGQVSRILGKLVDRKEH